MFNSLSATLLIFIATTGAAFAAGRENAVKIQFEFNGATVVGSLDESAAANEFLAQLPMTVKLEDYGSTEKIAWLPTKLRRADSGASMTPRRGDIAYYAPWGNLAIFARIFAIPRADKPRADRGGTRRARPGGSRNGNHPALLSSRCVKFSFLHA